MTYIANFTSELLKYSEHNSYQEAIKEWVDYGDHFNQEGFCICGHAIIENCPVRNKLNGNALIVGNCCIRKFGVVKKHPARSKRDYLEMALQRAGEGDEWFVKYLISKLEKYPDLKMTEIAKERLEGIAGRKWKWKWNWNE